MARATFEISNETEKLLERYFADEEGEIDFEAVAVYACRRKKALDKHATKVVKVKAAIREGKALPAVEFRRYTPTFKAAKLDAAGTPKEIAKFVRSAPETVKVEVPAPKAKAPKAKAPKAKARKFGQPDEHGKRETTIVNVDPAKVKDATK